MKDNIYCALPILSVGGWGWVEPPTKFQKRGAWQDLNFERGVAGNEGGNFFQEWWEGNFYKKNPN